MTPLIAEMVKLAPDPELMQWFDASGIPPNQTVDLDVVNTTPLPFDKCAVAGVEGDAKWLILLVQVDDVVFYVGWTLHQNHYTKHPAFTYIRTDEGIKLHPIDEDEREKWNADDVRGVLAGVGAWLKALSPDSLAYKPTARKSHINSKRAAKGKGPILFDWHTVHVTPAKQKRDYKGGTHASPRLHDRRGHWRKYPSGKVGWVKNCKVGDASKGVVFKDYEVMK